MQEQNEQISFGKLIGRFASSPAGLPGLATLCLLVATFAPVAIFKLPPNSQLATLGLFNDVTVSGLTHVGWWAFIPIAAFAAATLTRILPAVAPYRKLTDQLAFLTLAGVLVWALTGGAIGADIREARDQMRSMMGSRIVDQFRFLILPYFGAILAIVAPVLLIAARVRESPRKTTAEVAPENTGSAEAWLSAWGGGAIMLGLTGAVAIGVAIVGIVGFFLFGGVGPNRLNFFLFLLAVVAAAGASGLALDYVTRAKLGRPAGKTTIFMILAGAGSAGAGIMIALMSATDHRVGAVRATVAVLAALIPFIAATMVRIAARRARSMG